MYLDLKLGFNALIVRTPLRHMLNLLSYHSMWSYRIHEHDSYHTEYSFSNTHFPMHLSSFVEDGFMVSMRF